MEHEDRANMEAEAAAGLDDVPVRLAFDLGRLELPLGELRRLGAGSVIETSLRVEDGVEISANGRLIGRGELVDVEGRLGVRVLRIFDHG